MEQLLYAKHSESRQDSMETHEDHGLEHGRGALLMAEGPRWLPCGCRDKPQDRPHVRQNPVDWEDTGPQGASTEEK